MRNDDVTYHGHVTLIRFIVLPEAFAVVHSDLFPLLDVLVGFDPNGKGWVFGELLESSATNLHAKNHVPFLFGTIYKSPTQLHECKGERN